MPLFLEKNLFFIHIPKTGGTSIEKILIDNGFDISFFTHTGSIFVNGHTPQHMTFIEIQNIGLDKNQFNFFTIIRDPLERVISEYNYLLNVRPDISQKFNSFDSFLELFLDEKNSLLFDNHNLSCYNYLINKNGEIDKRIKIINFFNIDEIENIIGLTGLVNYKELKFDKKEILLTNNHIQQINEFYKKDYEILKNI